MISAWTCIKCGLPAEMRYGEWVCPECANCWTQATPAELATHETQMKRLSAEDDHLRLGHGGVTVTPLGLRIRKTAVSQFAARAPANGALTLPAFAPGGWRA